MNGWIVYNTTLKIKKIEDLVDSLCKEAKKLDINLVKVNNLEIIPFYDNNGIPSLIKNTELIHPEFIIFWDKDILLARHLENMGFRVFNSSEAIEACDHKGLMHIKLSNANIKVPKTFISPLIFNDYDLGDRYIEQIFESLGKDVVVKESKGSFGMQVYRCTTYYEFKNKIYEISKKRSDYIVQENISTSYGRDIRVNIIGGKIIGAMYRENLNDFRANISSGGSGRLIELTEKQKKIALMAHKALNLDFSGVDILFDKYDEPILCEINSNLNYLSFEKIWGKSFGKELLKYIVGECNA